MLQRLFQGRRLHVRADIAEQVCGAGLHPIRLGIQRARPHPYRFAVLVVALGVERHLILRHMHIGVLQAEFWQQGLLHQVIKRLAHAVGGEVAEQAKAGVRIQSVAAGGVERFPLFVVAEHFVGRIRFSRKLQG
ncbi:hypothetical protein D9M71_551870 [compost metagenome]